MDAVRDDDDMAHMWTSPSLAPSSVVWYQKLTLVLGTTIRKVVIIVFLNTTINIRLAQ